MKSSSHTKSGKLPGRFRNYWYRSAFFTLMQRASLVMFGMVTYILLVHSLSAAQIGVWALFLAITTTFEMSKNALLKFGLVTIFHSTEIREERASIASSSLVINILFTLLFLMLVFGGAHGISNYWKVPALEPMLYLYGGTALIFIPFSHLDYIQQTNMTFKGIFASYFIRQAVFFLLVVAGISKLHQNLSLDALVLFQMAGTLLGTLVAFYYSRKFLSGSFNPSFKWIKSLIGYGKFVFGSGICANLFGSMDRYMTASFLNSVDVAFYDVGARINNMIDVPTSAAADILFPKSAQASFEEGKEKVRYMYEKMAGILAGLVLPFSLLILVFAGPVVRIIAGEKYLAATSIIRIAMIYALLRPVQIQASNIFNSINKPHITFCLNIAVLTINLVFNYLAIQWFGFMGAAYATFASTLFSFGITFYFLNRAIGARISGVARFTGLFYRDSVQQTLRIWKRLSPGPGNPRAEK